MVDCEKESAPRTGSLVASGGRIVPPCTRGTGCTCRGSALCRDHLHADGDRLKGSPLPNVGVTSAIPSARPSGVPSARPIRLSCRIVGQGEGVAYAGTAGGEDQKDKPKQSTVDCEPGAHHSSLRAGNGMHAPLISALPGPPARAWGSP